MRLLKKVEESDTKLGAEFEKALGDSQNGLVAKLAEGLQQFIGYNGQDGKIGTGGIAVSNLPIERLRDAVLMFIGPFLGVLRGYHPELKNKYATQLGNAVEVCKKGVGCGQQGFEKAITEVKRELEKVSSGLSGGINDVLNKVKEVNGIKSKDDVRQLANDFKQYFTGVLDKVADDNEVKRASQVKTPIGTLKSKLGTLVEKVGEQKEAYPINVGESASNGQQGLKQHIENVNRRGSGALAQLYQAFNANKMYTQNRAAFALSAAAYNGANLFVTVLQTDYTSYYKDETWQSGSDNPQKCAKMFLACLPLIFNGRSYFYWKCSHDKGWNKMTLGSPEPKAFMNIMTEKSRMFNGNKSGADVLSQAFGNFNEFTKCTSSATSYAEFLKTFRGNCLTAWKDSSDANDNFLSGLYLCSTSYFRHKHQKKAATARHPSSIREMLYWLMGLTATPQFGDLLGHIHNVVNKNFRVAVSGSSNKNETLSADQVTSYILATCYTCPSVLNIIQGRVPPEEYKDKPWLHELYSNSAFPFKYSSSGVALFYALSDYTYALQFQLSFLYKQCQDMYINTCGWQFCTFGKDINATLNDQIVQSHLCVTGCTKSTGEHKQGDHGQGPCQHTGCGETSRASPLQAFLTDNLKGFSRSHPSDPSSHLATCSGYMCHVPMGFTAENLRDGSVQGGNISLTLKPFCGSHNTPLRQLCGTLTCLSKRAPRSLGDLFGFYWQVTGQLFNDVKTEDSDPSNQLSDALSQLLSKLTTVKSGLLYESITENVKAIGSHFFGLSWHCHRKRDWKTVERNSAGAYCTDHSNSSKARDLMSLYDSECSGTTCGKYLQPLTMSDGATFAPTHASTYLSWVLYLTDDLQSWFQDMLDEFKNIDCWASGYCRI
ncbi:variant erythrocyte surface antigen-1 family protein [Babesia caballi]|uniref:Variant erythrocyte surface antigen-1 family protein n=1 Tax=Babesia caballi TaxID=5871 RepID=A0AAV4LP55_BABCB|nr:variant erythrocyte surface antigen-1 family protein [Babesia caballi]